MSAPSDLGHITLTRAAALWFFVSATGQLIFVAYMAGFYGPTLVTGDFAQWTREKNLIDGYKAGDVVGNFGFISHIVLAFLVTCLGIAQLIPAVRQRAPGLHRWCGRTFMVAALIAAIGGLALVWLRGTQSSLNNSIAISLNGALIIASAILAWRAALRRDFARHQRWAFRLWLVVNGVWFLRVGMAAFGIISFGMLRMEKPPFAAFFALWGFGSYLVPLAIYEIYWRAKTEGGPAARIAMAVMLGLLTLVMAGGVAGMTIGQWLPMILAPPL